jgi:hypothetical protein
MSKAFSFGDAVRIRQASPKTVPVYRYWVAHQEPFLPTSFTALRNTLMISSVQRDRVLSESFRSLVASGSPVAQATARINTQFNNQILAAADADPLDGARRFIALFRDALSDAVNLLRAQGLPTEMLIESLNEGDYQEGTNRIIRFDVAFCDALAELDKQLGYPGLRPVVFCAPVGNPTEDRYPALVELGRKVETCNGFFGYHCYWYANPRESGLESWWPWHAGRWTKIDEVLVANGVKVRWFGGESGAVGSSNGYVLLPNDGWRADSCYDGDYPRFSHDLLLFDQKAAEWNAEHDDRFENAVIFTTNGPGWDEFEFQRGQMEALMLDLLARYP